MQKFNVVGRMLKINRENNIRFYTVCEIIKNTDDFLAFKDKYNKEIYCRWKDVIQVF